MKKKNDIRLRTLQSQKVQKMTTMLQGTAYILFTLPTIKTIKMAAKEFRFRIDLLWTGLGENYFLWAKVF